MELGGEIINWIYLWLGAFEENSENYEHNENYDSENDSRKNDIECLEVVEQGRESKSAEWAEELDKTQNDGTQLSLLGGGLDSGNPSIISVPGLLLLEFPSGVLNEADQLGLSDIRPEHAHSRGKSAEEANKDPRGKNPEGSGV